MPLSLKKQIQKTKILNILNAYDVVLLFALLELPQKKRGYLKKQSNCEQINTHSTQNFLPIKKDQSFARNNFQALRTKGHSHDSMDITKKIWSYGSILGLHNKQDDIQKAQPKANIPKIVPLSQGDFLDTFLQTAAAENCSATYSQLENCNPLEKNNLSFLETPSEKTEFAFCQQITSSCKQPKTQSAREKNFIFSETTNLTGLYSSKIKGSNSSKVEKINNFLEHYGSIAILQLSNNSFKHITHVNGSAEDFFNKKETPFLQGQTLLIAFRHEKKAQYLYTNILSLYKGLLLGGFYKGKGQTRAYLKALCGKIPLTTKINTGFLQNLVKSQYMCIKAYMLGQRVLFLLLVFRHTILKKI